MSLCVNRSVHAKVGETVHFPGLALGVKTISPSKVQLNRGKQVLTLQPGQSLSLEDDTGHPMRVKVTVPDDSREVNLHCTNVGLIH